jgi:hypothetical protein
MTIPKRLFIHRKIVMEILIYQYRTALDLLTPSQQKREEQQPKACDEGVNKYRCDDRGSRKGSCRDPHTETHISHRCDNGGGYPVFPALFPREPTHNYPTGDHQNYQ